MRTTLGRAVLALVLVLTQMHFCESVYVLPTGLECMECQQLLLRGDNSAEMGDNHGDCHDCCKLRACQTPSVVEIPLSPPQFIFDIAILPEPVALPHLHALPPMRQRFQFTAGAPTNGPPLDLLSRGPPLSYFLQPFAGSWAVL
jgi:hypothetical protein